MNCGCSVSDLKFNGANMCIMKTANDFSGWVIKKKGKITDLSFLNMNIFLFFPLYDS